ncbi:hypothetical protein RclHR1_09950010 [Rhizophagus clarus]|uniref:Pentatricopeptide repeat domain-containing protein n=1 Tax=Rhizophagus clarus TaxID=94130 RepID=A0A2Z6S6A4_9GLOM|nr:hypothetical protein RclHR1_09950010 [Rhizophagus clarus]GES94550.1 pentatricopeptide repeat domain-containing protein [Rhizophagus clarus]
MVFQSRIASTCLQVIRSPLTKYHSHNIAFPITQHIIFQKYNVQYNSLSRILSHSRVFASVYSTHEHIVNSAAKNILLLQHDISTRSETSPQVDKAQMYLKRMKNFLDTNNLEAITKEFIDLKEKNILPTLEIYHILLQMCYKASDLNSALEIFTQIYTDTTNSSILPTKETYKYLLDVVEVSSDHFLSLQVIKSIVNGQIPFVKSSKTAYKIQKKLDINLDLDVWNSIFRSLTTSHKLYSTRDPNYFKEVKGLSEIFLNSNSNYHDFTEETWQLIIRALGTYTGPCKKFDEMVQKIQSLEQMPMTPAIYSQLIWAFSRKSLMDLAIKNLDKLISQYNYIPSREPLYILLSYYADLGNYQEVEHLLNKYIKFVTIHEQSESSQQKNWQFNFTTILMKAYVQALRKEVSFHIKNLEEQSKKNTSLVASKESNSNILNLTKDNFTRNSFYVSWKKLLNEVKLSNSKYNKDHFELMIRFHILANQINHQEFPLNEALNMIYEMKGDGIEPTFDTFKILLEGHANSPEYNSSKPTLYRVENTLGIFNMMKSFGYDVKNIDIFQTLLDSCIPKYERFTDLNFKPIRLKIEEKIKYINNLIKIHKVKHNQKSMLTLLELYGCIHSFSEMRHIWFDMFLSGYHRNLNFYKTFIKASSQNIRESTYCLDVLRHQMSKEYPPVFPDLETYNLLLKCCIKSNDLITMKQITNYIMKHYPSSFSDSKKKNGQ